jgi:hypothetical protein
MNNQPKTSPSGPVKSSDLTRSHLIFVAVGLAIIVGGLWLLYVSDAPYHPDVPVSGSEDVYSTGS